MATIPLPRLRPSVDSPTTVEDGVTVYTKGSSLKRELNSDPISDLNKRRKTGNVIEFPTRHENESGNWILFTPHKYTKPNVESDAQAEPTGSTLALPVPMQLQTGYQATWENMDFGVMGNQVAKFGSDKIDAAKDGRFLSSVYDSMKNFGQDYVNVGKNVAASVAIDAAASTDIGNKIGAFQGIARNPHQAAIYKAPQFRKFDFSYKLFPRNIEESRRLNNMIRQFKTSMHPDYSDIFENNLYTYPDMFRISFTYPKYLFKFGWCVLTGVGVDYHAENVPVYHTSGSDKIPAAIRLNLHFQEIEILTREHFNAESGF